MESCSLYGPTSYFSATDLQDFKFLKAIDNWDRSKNAKEELRHLTECFSQFQAHYVFLETKQGLLERINSRSDEQMQFHQQIPEFEKKVEESHQAVKELNKKVKELKQAVLELNPALELRHGKLIAKHSEFERVYNRTEWQRNLDTKNRIADANRTGSSYGNSEHSVISMSNNAQCQTVLRNQEHVLLELEKTVNNSALGQVHEELRRIQSELEQLAAAFAAADKAAQLEKVVWYQAATACIAGLGKFDVSLAEGALLVAFRDPAPGFLVPPRLVIQFDQDGNRMLGASLLPPTVAIDDVVSQALAVQDLGFLVGEVHARVGHHGIRLAKLQEVMVQLRLPLEFEDHLLVVRVPLGSQALVCKFDIHPFFPTPGPIVIHVDRVSSLSALAQRLNGDCSLSLEDRIRALFRAAQPQ